MYRIEKIQRIGNGFKERLIIKDFRFADNMYEFLGKDDNSMHWKESNRGLSTGTYVFAGGKWQNVKNIDPTALAHM